MDVREKLVELLKTDICPSPLVCDPACRYSGCDNCFPERYADHLIDNGVRLDSKQATSEEKQATEFPKDFGRWIPVEERKPDLIPCSAGTAYSEAVNVLTAGHKVITAIWDGEDFIGDAEFWEAENEDITHWTPVLLPLPEPPKGEQR